MKASTIAVSSALPAPLMGHDLFAALGVVVIWGLNFVAMKYSLRDFTPFQLGTFRYLFAVLPLLFFVKRPKLSWRWLVPAGLAQFGQFGLLFVALQLGMTAALVFVVLGLTGCANNQFTRIGFPNPITEQGKTVVTIWQRFASSGTTCSNAARRSQMSKVTAWNVTRSSVPGLPPGVRLARQLAGSLGSPSGLMISSDGPSPLRARSIASPAAS